MRIRRTARLDVLHNWLQIGARKEWRICNSWSFPQLCGCPYSKIEVLQQKFGWPTKI
jgi:hypothetical protein